MSYNILSGSVNFEGAGQGSIEDIVDKHSTQTITGAKTFSILTASSGIRMTGLAAGTATTSSYLALDASNQVVLTSSTAGGGGTVTAVGGVDNRVATFSSATVLNGEANLTFDGSVLDFKASSISGSGNISGSNFYGNWAGADILGSQIQLASAKGIQDDSGLALNVAGLATATPAGSNTVIIDQGAGAKKCTVTNLMANAPVSDASALGNAGRVLLDGGVGAISTNANLFFGGTPQTLSVAARISGSTTLEVGSHITSSGDVVVSGDVIATGNVTASAIQIADYITHAGDLNTFFGFGGDDLIAFVAGGTQMLTNYGNLTPKRVQVGGSDFRVNTSGLDFQINNSNGFVGIGDTSPSVPLEISSSNDPQFKIVYHGSNAATFKVASNGNLTIGTNGATTVDSNLTINGNTVLGDNSADQVTFTGTNIITTNGLNFDGGTLVLDHTNNRIGIGAAGPTHTLSISGSFQASGSGVTTRFHDSRLIVSASTVIGGGGGTLFEINSPSKPNILAVTEGGVIASNVIPAAFNANLYISGAAVIGAPTAVVPDANLHSGSVTFYLDEGNNKLKFKVRYSNGTIRNGEINLT